MIETGKDIWDFSLSKEIAVTAEYFQQSLNVAADLTFQNFRDLNKWLLTPQGDPMEVDFRNGSVCIQSFSSDPRFYGIDSRFSELSNRCFLRKLGKKDTTLCISYFFTGKFFLKVKTEGAPMI